MKLKLLVWQQFQIRNVIYQNWLALDYLLAEEGGVCGKFDQAGCSIQIDDIAKAVTDIAKNIRKIAHVLFQTWKGWDTHDLFGRLFSWIGV